MRSAYLRRRLERERARAGAGMSHQSRYSLPKGLQEQQVLWKQEPHSVSPNSAPATPGQEIQICLEAPQKGEASQRLGQTAQAGWERPLKQPAGGLPVLGRAY